MSKYFSGLLFPFKDFIHISMSHLYQLHSNCQVLVNKILDFVVFKSFLYVRITILAWKLELWLPLYTELLISGRFCSLYFFFFYCLTCFSPSCSLIISIICFDWVSEITYLGCAVFLPLDFMTPLFSWLSCPCKCCLLFCPGPPCHVLLAARIGCGAFLW